ncbi:hypothetical protein A2U01_0079206, partial [Trifolium medium]|nr:hypothetical protein [Trifolium medium]
SAMISSCSVFWEGQPDVFGLFSLNDRSQFVSLPCL